MKLITLLPETYYLIPIHLFPFGKVLVQHYKILEILLIVVDIKNYSGGQKFDFFKTGLPYISLIYLLEIIILQQCLITKDKI